MLYVVPTSKAKKFLENMDYVTCTDEGEAVAMACGYYLAKCKKATVLMGENGLLNALDAIITLSQLHGIPFDLLLYLRDDEPQHKVVADKVPELLKLFNIEATIR